MNIYKNDIPESVRTCGYGNAQSGAFGCSSEGEEIVWTEAQPALPGYMAWGPWDDLPEELKQKLEDISLPTQNEIATLLGEHKVTFQSSIYKTTGTASYSGDAEGVFHPNWFGVIYGTKDNPNTELNEYDDGAPRVALVVNFDNNYIDAKLTARRPADDIASLPDSGLSHAPTYLTRYKVVNKGLAALGEPTYATFGDYADDAPITDAEMRGTSLIWALEMKENGIFEDDGFSGQILDVCTADPCSALNNPENLKTNEVIRGIINHYRFVGSYIATKE